jgi:hypothetical protein
MQKKMKYQRYLHKEDRDIASKVFLKGGKMDETKDMTKKNR